MATAAKILDAQRFESRARLADVAAFLVLLVVGFALMVSMYRLGYSASSAIATGAVLSRDASFVVAMVESALAVLSLAWIAYRLFTKSARSPGG